MSEDKIDRIDKRVNELVNITGNLVKAVNHLAEQQNRLAEQQNKFAIEQNRLAEQQNKFAESQNKLAEEQKKFGEEQRITKGRLEDVIRVVIESDKKHEEFRRETNENFEILREENKIINRKVEWATTTSLDAEKRVEALEQRVAKLEEKFAA